MEGTATDGTPPTQVLPHVYLSGATSALQDMIQSNAFSHIVVAMNGTPAVECLFDTKFDENARLHVDIEDQEEEMIIHRFAEVSTFVENAITDGGTVVVVCSQGVSRSVTLVLAYMVSSNIYGTLDECISLIQSKHPAAAPNVGFLKQLTIWERMGCRYDAKGNAEYRSLLAQDLAQKLQETDLHERTVKELKVPAEDEDGPADMVYYRCKFCRTLLATSNNIMTNIALGGNKDRFYGKKHGKQVNTVYENSDRVHGSIFVEPLRWMEGIMDATQGKLYCPKCKSRLGSFNWSGMQNDEATWVTPAFQLHQSKIDPVTKPASHTSASGAMEGSMPQGNIRQPKLLGRSQIATMAPQVHQNSSESNIFIIFDCDGVLVNSERSSCEALRRAILEVTGFDIPHLFPEDFVPVFGMDVRSCIQYYSQTYSEMHVTDVSPDLVRNVTESKERHYTNLTSTNGISAFPGVKPLLEELSKRHIPTAIASSGSVAKIRHNLTSSTLSGIIPEDRIISAQQVAQGKPHPDVYIEAMRRLQCTQPKSCVVIEDAIHGIRSALRAGVGTILAVTTSLPPADMESQLSQLCMTSEFSGTREVHMEGSRDHTILFRVSVHDVSRETSTTSSYDATVCVCASVPSSCAALHQLLAICNRA